MVGCLDLPVEIEFPLRGSVVGLFGLFELLG